MPVLQPLTQWFCDSCKASIEKPEDGCLEYLQDTRTDLISAFRIVHCRPSCHYNEESLENKDKIVNDIHLAHVITYGFFGHMLNWLDLTETKKSEERIVITEFTEIMRRLYLPHWEEARQYWQQAFKDGCHDKCSFEEDDLLHIISRYE